MAKNIRFHYLHRDSGNYKKFGHKDFSNPDNFSIDEIKQKLESHLIDGMFFYPEKVGIEKFRFHRYCDDYSWYEMEMIEIVVSRKCKESISDFIALLKSSGHGGVDL
tara:strand:+ start:631 stop:951 length:321 start_codon:yes stop_codon:yes gene_type:complete